jgi:hypothetical protein
MNVKDAAAIAQKLEREAGEKFGAERAAELRDALAQMANEIHALQSYQVSFDDEP